MKIQRVLRRSFVVAACVSFVLNALVAGVALRAYHAGVLPFAAAGDLLTHVPAEGRAAFLDRLHEEEPRVSALRRALSERRANMLRAVTAKDPDPVEVRAAMVEVQTATTALQSAIQQILLETLVTERTGDR